MNQILIAKAQVQIVEIMLILEKKGMPPQWPAGTVIDGKKVGGQVKPKDDQGSLSSKVSKILNPKNNSTTADFNKKVGLLPGMVMGEAVRILEKAVANEKELEDKIGILIEDVSDEISSKYENISQAKFKWPKLPSFKDKIEALVLQYENSKKYLVSAVASEKKAVAAIGDLIKASIPIATIIALVISPDIAIGLFAGKTLSEIMVGSALSIGAFFGASMALDAAHVENAFVRMGVQIAVGFSASHTAKILGNQLSAIYRTELLEVQRIAAYEADLLKEVKNKIVNEVRLNEILKENKINSQEVLKALKREVLREKKAGKIELHSFSERLNGYTDLAFVHKSALKDTDLYRAMIGQRSHADKKRMLDGLLGSKKFGDYSWKTIERHINTEANRSKETLRNAISTLDTYRDPSNFSKSMATSIDWHKGIINAELKYGDLMDEYRELPKSKLFGLEIVAIHDKFLKAIRGNRVGTAKIEIADAGFFKDKKRFTSRVIRTEGSVKVQGRSLGVKERIAEVAEASKEAAKLSSTNLGTIVVGYAGSMGDEMRGFVDHNFRFIHAGFVNDSKDVAFHEVGHIIERSKELAQASSDYILSRGKVGHVPTLIDGHTVTVTDFGNQYTGKIYKNIDTPTATEVLSMGAGMLSSPLKLFRMIQEDADHLRYTLYALDK